MIKLYDESGQRLTKLGAWTSKSEDDARVESLRLAYGKLIPPMDDAELIDKFELYMLSEANQDWLTYNPDKFIVWLREYPRTRIQ